MDLGKLRETWEAEKTGLKACAGITRKPYNEVGDPFPVAIDDAQTLTPEQKLALWSQYRHDPVHTTETFEELIRKIRRLGTSPLLPIELLKLIREFGKQAYTNLHLIEELMNQAASEFPAKSIKGTVFISEIGRQYEALYFKKLKTLDEEQAKILQYVYTYLQVEKIMPKDLLVETLKSGKIQNILTRIMVGYLKVLRKFLPF